MTRPQLKTILPLKKIKEPSSCITWTHDACVGWRGSQKIKEAASSNFLFGKNEDKGIEW